MEVLGGRLLGEASSVGGGISSCGVLWSVRVRGQLVGVVGVRSPSFLYFWGLNSGQAWLQALSPVDPSLSRLSRFSVKTGQGCDPSPEEGWIRDVFRGKAQELC